MWVRLLPCQTACLPSNSQSAHFFMSAPVSDCTSVIPGNTKGGLFQTSKTGGQRYSDTSPFIVPWSIYMPSALPVCPSFCLSHIPSVHLSICPYVHLSLSLSKCPYVYLYSCLSICPPVFMSVHLSLCPSYVPLSFCRSIFAYVQISMYLFIFAMSICLYVGPSVPMPSVFLSACLSNLSIGKSVCLFVGLCVDLPFHLSSSSYVFSVCPSCLSVSLFICATEYLFICLSLYLSPFLLENLLVCLSIIARNVGPCSHQIIFFITQKNKSEHYMT